MNKSKLFRITALFFVLMLLFTILSRAAYQGGTAVVTTGKPANRVIEHRIECSGKIQENQELAVTTEPDQRITSIAVQEGQMVKKGDLLFEIDLDVLEEKILNQQQEIEKHQLQSADTKSQQEVKQEQKANEQAQASEQYSLSVGKANTALNRSRQALTEAKQALADYGKNSSQTQQAEDTVEQALQQDCDEKAEAYIQAENDLSKLQWEIEDAVKEALAQVVSGASLSTKTGVKTQAADGEKVEGLLNDAGIQNAGTKNVGMTDRSELEELSASGDLAKAGELSVSGDLAEAEVMAVRENQAETGDVAAAGYSSETEEMTEATPASGYLVQGTEDDLIEDDPAGTVYGNQMTGASEYLQENSYDSGLASDTLIEEDFDTDILEPDTSASGVTAMEAPATEAPVTEVPVTEVPVTETPETEGPDLDLLEAQIRNRYQPELTAAKHKVEQALTEKKAAAAALEQYQTAQLSAAGSEERQSRQQLIANVKAAQSAYEDAALAANDAAITSGRAVATANLSEASDSSQRLNEITGEQMQLALDKLEKLKQNQGKVTAPEDGLITSVLVQAGEKTTDTAALRMANLSKGYRFEGALSKDQEKYIGTGDLVTLTGSGQKEYTDLAVESVTVDETDETIYHIVVPIPEDTLTLGASATLSFAKKSKAYSSCVPLSALHLDEKNQPYVLVVDESESIMGTEQKARKVSVTILEQNESYAALAEGGITTSQEIIISSSKAVDDGSRVRTENG